MKKCVALMCAASLLPFSACAEMPVVKSQDQQIVVSLSWWGNDTRNEYTIAAVNNFEKLNPNIKVDMSYSEWSGYEARSRIRMISDTESDVMQINIGWLEQYSPDGGGYYDISALADYIDLSSFSEDMLEYGKTNGVLNAIPIAMNCETVYVNKTIYDKYGISFPESWDDLFSAAKIMKKDGIYPMSAGSKAMWLYAMSYAEQVVGKDFLNDQGKLNFSAKDLECMIGLYCDMVKEQVIPQVEYYERINIDNGTYAGTVAWVSDAVNYCGTAVNNGYEFIPAPYTTESGLESGTGWHAKPAPLYAISKNTEHPRESAMLLDFLLNSREMALLQGVEKGIPLSSSARGFLDSEGELKGLQYDASLLMENNTALTQLDPLVENNNMISAYIDCCNLVIYDKADISEAAKELHSKLGKEL